MPRIDINHCNLALFEQGSRQPVVLLHSSGASGAQWRVLVDKLSHRFHMIAPDLYGYGATAPWPGHGEFSLADEAALIHTLLDGLDEPAHLIGHSYGGAVALHVARTRCEGLRSLTLIEPVAFHLLRDGDETDLAALREIIEIAGAVTRSLGCGDYQDGLGRFIDYWSGPGTWASIPTSKRGAMAKSFAKVALDFHATINDASHLGDFEMIATPTMLVQGGVHRVAGAAYLQPARSRAALGKHPNDQWRRAHVAIDPSRRGQRSHRCTRRREHGCAVGPERSNGQAGGGGTSGVDLRGSGTAAVPR